MPDNVIQIRDFQNKRDIDRLYAEDPNAAIMAATTSFGRLEQQAIEIMNVALLEDTAPSEYIAPKDDPA